MYTKRFTIYSVTVMALIVLAFILGGLFAGLAAYGSVWALHWVAWRIDAERCLTFMYGSRWEPEQLP